MSLIDDMQRDYAEGRKDRDDSIHPIVWEALTGYLKAMAFKGETTIKISSGRLDRLIRVSRSTCEGMGIPFDYAPDTMKALLGPYKDRLLSMGFTIVPYEDAEGVPYGIAVEYGVEPVEGVAE